MLKEKIGTLISVDLRGINRSVERITGIAEGAAEGATEGAIITCGLSALGSLIGGGMMAELLWFVGLRSWVAQHFVESTKYVSR